MIDDAERERIREEERFRFEIRRALAAETKRSARWSDHLFTFVNSPVGIFLLSTVLVGAFTWSTSALQRRAQLETGRIEAVRRLRLELDNRYDEVQRLRGRFRAEYRKVVWTAFYGFRQGETTNPSWQVFYTPVFPEYGARGIASLLAELAELEPRSDRPPVDALRAQTHALAGYLDRLLYEEEPASSTTPDHKPVEYFRLAPADSAAFDRDFARLPLKAALGR